MEKKQFFRKGEIIWAKIRGFPWWPGIIQSNCSKYSNSLDESHKVLVNFLGDNTHANIVIRYIEKYDKKFKEFSRTKKKGLLRAINIADKVLKGEINQDQALKSFKAGARNESSSHSKDKEIRRIKSPEKIEKEAKSLLNKRCRDKTRVSEEKNEGRKSSQNNLKPKIEDSTQDHEFVQIEENMTISPKKNIDFNTSDNESESSHESEFDIKKEIDDLIAQRISMPSSNSKFVIMSLERIHKHLFEKNNIYKFRI